MTDKRLAMVGGDSGFCRVVARLPARQGARLGSGDWRRSVSCIPCTLCRGNYLWLQQTARASKFQEVVNGAQQRPFALYRGKATPQELAEAARLVDLPKHRLDDLLAQPVGAFVTGSVQFGRHRRHPALRLGWPRLRRRRAVFLPAGGNMSVDLTGFERGQIVLRAIAGIGRDLLRSRREIGRDLLDQRLQMRAIARLVADHLGNNNLCRGVDRGLRVEALDEAVFGLHDPALGIGEVALRLARRRGRTLAAPPDLIRG